MDFTYGTIFLLGGIVLAILAVAVNMKKKTRQATGWIGGILLVFGAIGLLFPGTIAFLDYDVGSSGPTLAVSPVSGGSQPVQLGVCPPGSVEDVTVTLAAQNKYTAAASGGTHRYRVNGAPATTVSDAGTFTASAGAEIEVLWYNASTSGGYFSDTSVHRLDCGAGAPTLSRELVSNGTVTIQVFNEEGNLINGAAENETLAAGDVVTLEAKLKGQFQNGMPYGGILIAEYNTSEIDDVIIDFGGSKVSTPDLFTVSATVSGTKTYSIPAILSNQILDGTITIDADDTQNPGQVEDIDLYLYKNNYFINYDTGGSFDGPAVEDEDDAATMSGREVFVLAID
jgi:hypothetical protein